MSPMTANPMAVAVEIFKNSDSFKAREGKCDTGGNRGPTVSKMSRVIHSRDNDNIRKASNIPFRSGLLHLRTRRTESIMNPCRGSLTAFAASMAF